tara:strand:+ start:249 stop:641 length:393 start_codon:yes stop_codon:yes gene_type:complete
MNITNDGILLATIIKKNDDEKIKKNFYTENNAEFQVASFSLDKDEVIDRHFHPEQIRSVTKTSEVIIVKNGEILLTLYNKDLEKVQDIVLNEGDIAILIDGGHELTMNTDAKFIEVKQGPYEEHKDKKRF